MSNWTESMTWLWKITPEPKRNLKWNQFCMDKNEKIHEPRNNNLILEKRMSKCEPHCWTLHLYSPLAIISEFMNISYWWIVIVRYMKAGPNETWHLQVGLEHKWGVRGSFSACLVIWSLVAIGSLECNEGMLWHGLEHNPNVQNSMFYPHYMFYEMLLAQMWNYLAVYSWIWQIKNCKFSISFLKRKMKLDIFSYSLLAREQSHS